MLVYFQYARANPLDWEAVNIINDGDIRDLPKKDEPAEGDPGTTEADVGGGEGVKTVLDVTHADADDPGWISDISIQGQSLGGADWFHLDMDGGSLVVTLVMDDVDDHPGVRRAARYRYGLMQIDGSLEIPRLQPNITRELAWAEHPTDQSHYMDRGFTTATWADFSPPGPENKRRYGIWQETGNALAQELAKTTNRGYPEWIVESP